MSTPAPATAPAPETPHNLPGMGLQLPWMGALGGAAIGAGADLLGGRPSNWRRTLRKGLTGAAAGVGGELGLRLGGEMARRHSVAGGGPAMAGTVPVLGALGGTAAGYLLGREKPRDEDEEQ